MLPDKAACAQLKPELMWQMQQAVQLTQERVRGRASQQTRSGAHGCMHAPTATPNGCILLLLAAAACMQSDWGVDAHDRLLASVDAFFQQHDLLLCPTVMLPPFDATIQ